MIPERIELTPFMTVRHVDGLLYRIDDVRPSTIDYETSHKLVGSIINYTQLEQGDFPPGTQWGKDEAGFRLYFTVVDGSPRTDQAQVNPGERSIRTTDHWSANPQREAAARAVAEVLKRGYTLTNEELKEILPHYGYSPKSPAYSSVGTPGFRRFLQTFGVDLKIDRYKGVKIYIDESLPVEETDIEKSRAAIEAKLKTR